MSSCGWAHAYKYADQANKASEYQPAEVSAEQDVELITELKRVESLLERIDDDGEPLYSKKAFDRAEMFLTAQSIKAKRMYGVFAPIPAIGSGPEGSIDLHWKTKNRELLVNIPAEKPAIYYGDDYGIENKFKGSLNPMTSNFGIILWLMSK